jgi:hypothetical protein
MYSTTPNIMVRPTQQHIIITQIGKTHEQQISLIISQHQHNIIMRFPGNDMI